MSDVSDTSPAWRAVLEQLCERTGVADLPSDLIDKVQRPLFSGRLNKASRIQLLKRHYELLLGALGAEAVGRLLKGERLPIAAFNGRSGRRYLIDMGRDGHTGREGELAISLTAADTPDHALANLILTVGEVAPGAPLTLWIGGLQGAGGKGFGTAAADDLWGLKPKQVVLESAYALAHLMGACALKAASHETQADHDAFWRTNGGALDGQGAFNLPTVRLGRVEPPFADASRIAWRAQKAIVEALGAGFRDLAIG